MKIYIMVTSVYCLYIKKVDFFSFVYIYIRIVYMWTLERNKCIKFDIQSTIIVVLASCIYARKEIQT